MPASSETGTPEEDRDERFPRSHRLKRRRLIRALFDRRRDDTGTVAAGCVRLVFRIVTPAEAGADVPVQAGFAPGRCPTAVTRNRVRRLLRERYRRHQHLLVDLFAGRPGEVLTVMAIFRGNAEAPDAVHRDLPRALAEAARVLTRAASSPGDPRT
jgi:ribonuclease P protein component